MAVTLTDDFNRANNASLGSSWVDYGVGTALTVNTNQCRPAVSGSTASSRFSTAVGSTTHVAQVTVAIGATGDALAGPGVRADTAAFTMYVGVIDRSGAVLTFKILKSVGGSVTDVTAPVASGQTSGVLTLYASGASPTVLTLAVDGVVVMTGSDSTSPLSTQTSTAIVASGASTGIVLDDFSAGASTVPLAPTGLTAIPGAGQVALSWTAPFNGLVAITDYLIESSTDGVTWTPVSHSASTATSITVTGLTNGTAYRFRVSAINSVGTGPTSAVSTPVTPQRKPVLIGVGAQVVSTSTTITPTWPGGYTATNGDYSILYVGSRPTDTTQIATPSGFTLLGTALSEAGANDLRLSAYGKAVLSTDTWAAIAIPASSQGAAAGVTVQVEVWRTVDTTTPMDVTAVASTSVAAATWAPTGISPVTENTEIISAVATADDNALALSVANAYTLDAGGASYNTNTGGGQSFGAASRLGATKALVAQAGAPAQLTAIDNVAGTAFNYRWTGTGVTIYFAGAGIRGTHTEFTGRLGAGYHVVAATGADPFTDNAMANASFPQGHDTGVASVGAGTTVGVAKGATIFPITGLSAAESASGVVTRVMPAARVIDMANYIAANAVVGKSVMVWSNVGHASGDLDWFGGTITATDITNMTAAFQAIINLGIPICVAAGNQASATYPAAHFPMNMAGVINVGNVDAVSLAKSATSNFGSAINIWAVGSGTGTNEANSVSDSASTGAFDGTSEAAPAVAGVIACILQAHPTYTLSQITAALYSNALVAGATGAGSNTRLLNSSGIPDGGVGASVAPTWSQTVNGNDAWAGLTLALRPAPPSFPQTTTAQIATLLLTTVSGVPAAGVVTVTAQRATLLLVGVAGTMSIVGGAGQSITAQVAALLLTGVPGNVIGSGSTVVAQVATLRLTGLPGTLLTGLTPLAVTAQVAVLTLTGVQGVCTGGPTFVVAQVASLMLKGVRGLLILPFAVSAHTHATPGRSQRVEIRVNHANLNWALFVRAPAVVDVERPGYYVANAPAGVDWYRAGVLVASVNMAPFVSTAGTIELECVGDLCTLRVHGMAVSTHDFSANPLTDDDEHQGFASYGGSLLIITDAEGGRSVSAERVLVAAGQVRRPL